MGTLIHQLQADYERFVDATASRRTGRLYSISMNRFFDYFPEKTDPRDFAPMDIDDYRAYARKRGLSAVVVNYDVQIIRAFFNWCIRQDAMSYNPAANTRKLKTKEPVRTSLSEEAQRQVYAACLDDRERLLVGLALTTGLRPVTLVQLEKSEFDLERKVLSIPPEKMKTSRGIELPIMQTEIELVRALPKGNLWGAWAKTSIAISRRFSLVLSRAGLGRQGLRTARRTVATTLLRNGVDVRIVRDLLGHTNIATTNKYLTPATNDEILSALEIMPR
jgi:integrase/recombinase XerD